MGGIQNQGNPDEHHCQRFRLGGAALLGFGLMNQAAAAEARTKKSAFINTERVLS